MNNMRKYALHTSIVSFPDSTPQLFFALHRNGVWLGLRKQSLPCSLGERDGCDATNKENSRHHQDGDAGTNVDKLAKQVCPSYRSNSAHQKMHTHCS